jgi:hypothetical protein
MPDYPGLANTVTRLIRDFGSGGQAKVERRVPGVYDPILDEDPGETTDLIDVEVVVLGTGADDITTRLDDLATTGRNKVYISGQSGFVPAVGDLMAIPGRAGKFVIQDVKATSPDGGITTGGLALMFECIIDRRGDL